MPRRMYVRRFLNRPGHHGAAFLLLQVEDTSRSNDEHAYPEISFELADCWRRIELDFPLSKASERRNSLYKARLLRDSVASFVEALEAEAALAERRSRRPAGKERENHPAE